MRLGIPRAALLAGLVSLTLAWAAPGDRNKPGKEDAAKLLAESAELRSITAPGCPAFHLIANVHLVDEGKGSDGTYEMLWEKPDRFRVVYSFPWYQETEFLLEDKEYLLRPAPYIPLMIWRLRTLLSLGFPRPAQKSFPAQPLAGFEKVAFHKKNGTAMSCVEIFNGPGKKQVCLDAATKDLLSIHLTTRLRSDTYEFGDYAPFGVKRIPQTMTLRQGGDFRVDVRVDKLLVASAFAQDVFVPPSNAKVRDWCSDPELSGKIVSPVWSPMHSPSGSRAPGGYLAAYLGIGTDGHVKELYLLRSLHPELEQNVLNWLSGMTFPIATCHGKPVEGETVLEIDRR